MKSRQPNHQLITAIAWVILALLLSLARPCWRSGIGKQGTCQGVLPYYRPCSCHD